MPDVTVKGWVIKETTSGMAVIFLWENRRTNGETVILPKSQIAVVKGEWCDEVTMPEWLAEDKGFI